MATTYPNYPATTFEQAVELAIFSSNQLHNIINADSLSTVDTEDGNIPSLRKALIDNLYFKTPAITWTEGQQVSVFNQLYTFSGGTTGTALWYAPTASSNNIIVMGSSPESDSNWRLYGWDTYNKSELKSSSGASYIGTTEGNTVQDQLDVSLQYIGDYSSGILQINSYNSVILYNGKRWYVNPNSDLPFSTTGTTSTSWGQDNSNFIAIGDTTLRENLADSVGFSYVGQIASFADLRLVVPTYTGQRVLLASWNKNAGPYAQSSFGSGEFIAVSGSASDDGGFIAKVSDAWYWQRIIDPAKLDVTHFGAIPDGATDCSVAAINMHNWSQSNANGIGIQFPAGIFNWGVNWDISDAEVAKFRMAGPKVAYGYFPQTTLLLSSVSDGIAVKVKARWTDISGFILDGDRFNNPNTRGFFQNIDTAGQFVRVSQIRTTYMGGRAFQLVDTLDTKFDQFYPLGQNAAFLSVTYSNVGTWDHATAVELSNFNIQQATGEDAILAVRCTQSVMFNGWFDHCENPFNISEGDWTMQEVSIEAAGNSPKAQYAKIMRMGGNWQTDIDYTNGASTGTIPSWVTSGYETGKVSITPAGSNFDCGLSSRYNYSQFRISNTTGGDTWFHIGQFALEGVGDMISVRAVGCGAFSSADGDMNAAGQNYGGGEATIYFQNKASMTEGVVSWTGQGSTPVKDVRYVQLYNNVIELYVLVPAYTMEVAFFIHSTGTSRLENGSHFVFSPSLATVSSIDDVTGALTAPAKFNFSNGQYGFGMDLTGGVLALNGTYTDISGGKKIPVTFNGQTLYLTLTNS